MALNRGVILNFNLQHIVTTLPIILLSLAVHEYFHAYVANQLGDPTARLMGRMTFNPFAHIDLFGMLAFILIGFGWAKPVPVNPYAFSDRKSGMIKVSIAGPLSNLALSILFAILYAIFILGCKFFVIRGLYIPGNVFVSVRWILVYGILINITLCVLNLLPFYPMDGSKVLLEFLNGPIGSKIAVFIQKYSYYLFLIILITGIFEKFMSLINSQILSMLNLLLS